MTTFKKPERLTGKTSFSSLFKSGTVLGSSFIKLIWKTAEFDSAYPVKAGFVVGKKTLKKAVDRNRIKRLMREAYRKHKQLLYEALDLQQKKIYLIVRFTGKEEITYQEIENKIIELLTRLRNSAKSN